MHHFYKNECMLDTISVVENFTIGTHLNWCPFLLKEMFKACEDVYKKPTHFIYGYLIIDMEIWKWCPLEGRELGHIIEDQTLALRYVPWRTSGDLTNKEIN